MLNCILTGDSAHVGAELRRQHYPPPHFPARQARRPGRRELRRERRDGRAGGHERAAGLGAPGGEAAGLQDRRRGGMMLL